MRVCLNKFGIQVDWFHRLQGQHDQNFYLINLRLKRRGNDVIIIQEFSFSISIIKNNQGKYHLMSFIQ